MTAIISILIKFSFDEEYRESPDKLTYRKIKIPITNQLKYKTIGNRAWILLLSNNRFADIYSGAKL